MCCRFFRRSTDKIVLRVTIHHFADVDTALYVLSCGAPHCWPATSEPNEQTYSSFDISVILLNQVIQIPVLPDGDNVFRFVSIDSGQCSQISATFIDGSPCWRMALRRKGRDAVASRLTVSRKSMV